MTVSVIYMFLTALLATLLYVILKYFARFKINILHGLTFNYLTAGLCAFCFNADKNIQELGKLNDIIWLCLGIGLLFITSFYLASVSTERYGIAITSIAGKMSMVSPFTLNVPLVSSTAVRLYKI